MKDVPTNRTSTDFLNKEVLHNGLNYNKKSEPKMATFKSKALLIQLKSKIFNLEDELKFGKIKTSKVETELKQKLNETEAENSMLTHECKKLRALLDTFSQAATQAKMKPPTSAPTPLSSRTLNLPTEVTDLQRELET